MNQRIYFVEKVNIIIKKQLDNPKLNGALIGEQMGISRMQMHRLLKLYTNQNARDYIKSIRIQKAKELLKTNQKIYQIAKQCGYPDYRYFTKVFKSSTGKSPSTYRKM